MLTATSADSIWSRTMISTEVNRQRARLTSDGLAHTTFTDANNDAMSGQLVAVNTVTTSARLSQDDGGTVQHVRTPAGGTQTSVFRRSRLRPDVEHSVVNQVTAPSAHSSRRHGLGTNNVAGAIASPHDPLVNQAATLPNG